MNTEDRPTWWHIMLTIILSTSQINANHEFSWCIIYGLWVSNSMYTEAPNQTVYHSYTQSKRYLYIENYLFEISLGVYAIKRSNGVCWQLTEIVLSIKTYMSWFCLRWMQIESHFRHCVYIKRIYIYIISPLKTLSRMHQNHIRYDPTSTTRCETSKQLFLMKDIPLSTILKSTSLRIYRNNISK